MGELKPELRRQLVDALLALPNSSNRGIRDQLVSVLPLKLQSALQRSESAQIDISNIVTVADNWGMRTLGMLLDHAIWLAGGSQSGLNLEALSLRLGLENERGTGVRPYSLPPLPPQGVFGREKELADIASLLSLDKPDAIEIPPVALRGMGGIGKTTLAIALGRQDGIQTMFPDGVLWTALGPDPSIRLLLNNWGRALGMDLMPERDEDACRDRLRAALYSRRILLIVDDVWEVVHGNYFQVAGPFCRLLFTTRESPIAHALATRERTIRVIVLSPEAALAMLNKLAPEAVAVDRAMATKLCERLEFLPLALNLAGRLLANEADVPSRMRRLVDELLEHREARLNLSQIEGRLGFEEDQPISLQAILGMSVARLSKFDQNRFAMLAVFGGEPLTWEINAAASVWECPLEEAEVTISHFIQRGLVEPQSDQRYWMHTLLSDYASEMLEELGL